MDLLTFRRPLGDTLEHILKKVNTYTAVVLKGKVVQSGTTNNSSAQNINNMKVEKYWSSMYYVLNSKER